MMSILAQFGLFQLDSMILKVSGIGVCLWVGFSAYAYVFQRRLPADPRAAAHEQRLTTGWHTLRV